MVDETQFEELMNKYRAELYRYCLVGSGGDTALADDAFSDMLSVVYKKWDTLEKGEAFRVYLYRIAEKCLMAQRRKKKLRISREVSLEAALAEGVLTEERYYDQYFADDVPIEVYIKRIEAALSREDLKLFRLRYVEKRPLLDIEKITAIPYSTLRYRYMKLEKQVREEIKKIFD